MNSDPIFDTMVERIIALRQAEYLYSNDPAESKNLCMLLNFAGGKYNHEKPPLLNFFDTYISITRDIDYIKLDRSGMHKSATTSSSQLLLFNMN
jgi:hypothetical protein